MLCQWHAKHTGSPLLQATLDWHCHGHVYADKAAIAI